MQIDLHSGYVTTISNTFHFFYHEDDGEHPFRQERPRARSVDSWERCGVKQAPSPEALTRELEAWWTRGTPIRLSEPLSDDRWLALHPLSVGSPYLVWTAPSTGARPSGPSEGKRRRRQKRRHLKQKRLAQESICVALCEAVVSYRWAGRPGPGSGEFDVFLTGAPLEESSVLEDASVPWSFAKAESMGRRLLDAGGPDALRHALERVSTTHGRPWDGMLSFSWTVAGLHAPNDEQTTHDILAE